MKKRKVFCGGIICRKYFRLNKRCYDCGIYVCNKCSTTMRRKTYCKDCALMVILDNDFEEMLNDIDNMFKLGGMKKNEIKTIPKNDTWKEKHELPAKA